MKWFPQRIWRPIKVLMITAVLAGAGALWGMAVASDWRKASHEPTGIAPDPAKVKEAIVQVYAARAFSWRGAFGVHTWISVKPTNALEFTTYQVIGWRAYRGMPVVSISNRAPDSRWYDAEPWVVSDLRGPGVDDVIKKIDIAAKSYPYPDKYRVWPGPNSNTFTAHVAREVPELKLDLSPIAIGKDYLNNGAIFAKSPSGTGVQFSVFGLFGLLAGVEEGVEINLLGLTFGIDLLDPAVKLPIIGRLGPEPTISRLTLQSPARGPAQ
jgi:hypothetical protein